MTEPKLVYVEFYDHSVKETVGDGMTEEDITETPIPISINSLCGWLMKEDERAVWVFPLKVEYPMIDKLKYIGRPCSEGYHLPWGILKSTIIRTVEVEIPSEVS